MMCDAKHSTSLVFICLAVAGAPRKVGSITEYDPMNNYYGSVEGQQRAMQQVWKRIRLTSLVIRSTCLFSFNNVTTF